jgi:cytoskeletal protein CcmA (bactofilin family)
MSIFERHRFKIINQSQHPFKHTLGDFSYNNTQLPGATTLEGALADIIGALWPNYKGTVATPANLPGGASINDYYIVTDDGDGKSAGYVYQMIDNVTQWIKRYDVDWTSDAILGEAINSTFPVYAHKWGLTDKDENGVDFAGDLAGQRIYGGDTANQHLTLYANSGDAAGNTGFVQAGDNFRPLVDSSFSLGTTTYRWSNFFSDAATVSTMSLAGGSITDTSGAISFGDENLSTTGTLGSGVITAASGSSFGNLTLSNGSITDSGGSISFGDENLSTTGTLASGQLTISSDMVINTGTITSVSGAISFGDENLSTTGTIGGGDSTFTRVTSDNLRLDGNVLSSIDVDGNIIITPNGTGVINLSSDANTQGLSVTGDITGATNITASTSVQLNSQLSLLPLGLTQVSNTDLTLTTSGTGRVKVNNSFLPSTDNALDLGATGLRFLNIYANGELRNDTNSIGISDLLTLRHLLFRDTGETSPIQDGDTLVWDNASGTFLANSPDLEIDHSLIAGLTTGDAGHTQFALLTGRAGGQELVGGTAANEDLTLESTSNATKGDIFVKSDLNPFTNANYTTSWQGTDLGDATHFYRDLYSKGEHKGMRVENFTDATIPAFDAQTPGRLSFATDTEQLYINTGSQNRRVGLRKFVADQAFNGTDLVKNVDVSSKIVDARDAIIQLMDNANNYNRIYCDLEATTATNVRITTNVALAAGNYRLVVIE